MVAVETKSAHEQARERRARVRSVLASYESQVEGEVEVWHGEYGSRVVFYRQAMPNPNDAILPIRGHVYALKRGDTPEPAGWWMDWPEKEWGLTKAQYAKLPTIERARMEAREQATKWVAKQYDAIKRNNDEFGREA